MMLDDLDEGRSESDRQLFVCRNSWLDPLMDKKWEGRFVAVD